jgi:hypothetical protein
MQSGRRPRRATVSAFATTPVQEADMLTISRIAVVTVVLAFALTGTSAAWPQDLRSPDARDAARTHQVAAPAQDLRSPDSRDAATGRGTYNAPTVTVVKVPQAAPAADRGGIDWGDVGIGAGALLVALLLAVGAAIALQHRRRTPVAA